MQLTNDKEIIIIPDAIYKQLLRNDLTLDKVLNLDEIFNILSMEDLCFLYGVNKNNSIVYLQNNIPNYLDKCWVEFSESYGKVLALSALYEKDCERRLKEITSDQEDVVNLYEVKDTYPNTLFCVIYPHMFVSEETTKVASTEMNTTVLKLLYDYNSYSIVARHPLYKGYISLLS